MKLTCAYNVVLAVGLACISMQLHGVKTVYIPRSQGHAPSMICLPAYELNVITTLNYAQSYNNKRIAYDLFGTDQLTFSGSQVPNRGAKDLLADNFGLAPDFQSILSFKPKIENILFAFYFNKPLDNVLPGLYVNVMFPINHGRWSLNPCEKVINRGALYFQNGYMGDTLATFTQASPITPADVNQNSCNTVTPAPSPAAPAETAANAQTYFSGNLITGDIIRPLAYNKISWCGLERTELAEIIVRLGRNLIITDATFLSVFARASFQTGNKQRPEYLFSPVCGNGKFFELGLGMQGQYLFTRETNPTHVTLFWDCSCEHLFRTQGLRTFDLRCQGPLSRYLLLKKIDKTTLSYDNQLIEASYITTFPVYVSRAIQGDIDLRVAVEHKGFIQTFGYALWGTTAENLCVECDKPTCPTGGNWYGVKGTSGAYYYTTSGSVATGLEPLNATEQRSTIFSPGAVDNPLALPNSTPYSNVVNTTVIDPSQSAYGSNGPLIIGCSSLDIDSARSPTQLTHAFLLETGYTWNGASTSPAVLCGASIETATHNPVELHQWSIWIKGSVAW